MEIGSINMDLVARCRNLPTGGETLTATSFAEIPGGKGANQAVAAARAGGDVTMIGRVGDDAFSSRLVANLEHEQIDCRSVRRTSDCASGLAVVAVETQAGAVEKDGLQGAPEPLLQVLDQGHQRRRHGEEGLLFDRLEQRLGHCLHRSGPASFNHSLRNPTAPALEIRNGPSSAATG